MEKTPRHFIGSHSFAITGMPFRVFQTQQPAYSRHDHDFAEIVLVMEGRGVHWICGAKYEISKGDLLIIPAHQDHAYLEAENLTILNIIFDPAEFEKAAYDLAQAAGYRNLISSNDPSSFLAKHKGRMTIPAAKFAAIVGMMNNIMTELGTKRTGYKAMASSLFIQAIGVVVRCLEHTDTPPMVLSRIEKTLEFIELHYNEHISLDQLVRLAHMSRSSFKRCFMKTLHTSPIDHLIRFRIGEAVSLLHSRPDLNVTEIALQVGFTNSNYFSRMFKKITKKSPREFRRAMYSSGSKKTRL